MFISLPPHHLIYRSKFSFVIVTQQLRHQEQKLLGHINPHKEFFREIRVAVGVGEYVIVFQTVVILGALGSLVRIFAK
jgi:hypothetical protein